MGRPVLTGKIAVPGIRDFAVYRAHGGYSEAEKALKEKMDEMMRFQKLTVGRELAMIELKKEINKLLDESGLEEKYKIVE